MGSVGNSFQVVSEPIKGTPLIFGRADIHENYIGIDGYSNKKTIEGALSDLAKAVEKYDKGEADFLRAAISNGETMQIHNDRTAGPAQYILEYEEVPSASQYNEQTGEMEYKNGRWYVYTRIVR